MKSNSILYGILLFAFTTANTAAKAQAVNVTDSLALVDLYNSTNGPGWVDHTNWLTGPVKDWYGITVSDTSVTAIALAGNQLSGSIPPELGSLTNLTYLELSENQLSGNIPPELGNLTNLTYMELSNDQLSGNIPPELGNLSSLSDLSLDYNQLSGSIPPELGNLTSLGGGGGLYLGNNQLTGAIPSELGNVSWVELGNNQLTGAIPSELGNVSGLNLEHNQLSGSIPTFTVTNLVYLNLDNNQLNGSIPSELGNLSNLSELYLNNNQFSGSIPPELGHLSNLSELDLSYNQLSGNIPPELGNILSLHYLNLNNNQLSGNISSELGNLANLRQLDLGNNQLSGNIPTELGNLSNLTYLDISYNQLSGNIPGFFYTEYLGELLLNNNKLDGPIPASLSALRNLSHLSLDHNRLSGAIPQFTSVNLEYLYLNDNQLSGAIPSSIANLYLYALDLSHNQFTFDGMEAVAQRFPFAKYSNQAIIPLHLNDNALSVSAGGTLSNNTYRWYEVGQPDSTTITGDSVYHPAQNDKYYAAVTNSVCTQLTLYTDTIDYSNIILPVTIINLAATQQKSFVQLAWTSVTETNVFRYEVLRSANSINFSTIGSMPAKGGGTAKQDYTFNDLQPGEAYNYYMLKIIDKDGICVYSNIVSVNLGKNEETTMVYPNPTKDILHVQTKGSVSVSLINQDGKILLTENITNTGSINVSGMPAGIYYLKNNNTNAVQKIFIEK